MGTPSRREVLAWLGAGVLLAVVMTWPLLLHLPSHVPNQPVDPLAEAWEVAWGGHALRTQPLHLFRANVFWPEHPSLAFSDSLIGFAPAAVMGRGLTAAVVRYNLLFLLAYALAFAGAALLARELGTRPVAAAVAGAGFAFAPWRIDHTGHLNVLSCGAIPLALALLAGGYRRGEPKRIVAGWLVAAWQVSLGFAIGIWFCYLLVALAAVAGAWWLRHGRPAPDRRTIRATLAGAGLFGLVTVALVLPYLDVLRRYPEAPRPRAEVEFYSPPATGLLAAPAGDLVWGRATEPFRDRLRRPVEQSLFPGLTIVVLAATGVAAGRAPRSLRAGLAAGVAVVTVLSLGYELAGGRLYRPLYDHAPGFQGLRTPGRLTLFASLGLALLAALGADRLLSAVASRLRTASVALLACLVVLEGSAVLPLSAVPRPPAGLAGLPDPQYHVPAGQIEDSRYMFWSIGEGFPKLGNGNTSFLPLRLRDLRERMESFPDPASVALLREIGYRVVVLHTDLAPGTPWAATAERPVDGLGITREERAGVLIYHLTPER